MIKIDVEATRARLVERGLIDASDGNHPPIPAWPCMVVWPIKSYEDGFKRMNIGVNADDPESASGYVFCANALTLTSAGHFHIGGVPTNPAGLNHFLNGVRVIERHLVWQQGETGQ